MKRFLLFFCINLLIQDIFAAPTETDPPIEQYDYSIITSLGNLNYKTAIHYAIENDHTITSAKERAARGEGSQVLAKYDVLIDNLAFDPNQGTPAGELQTLAPIDFTEAENTAQGWARMSDAAIPALAIVLNGETRGQASASWRTSYQVPGTGKRNVSLKFRLPETVMDGRFEFSAKGPHQARAKVQLLVNGYPVWWTETLRVAPPDPQGDSEFIFHNVGAGWSFDATSERATSRWVTASMGSYNPGQILDVILLYSIEASVGRECEFVANMFACMGISASFKRDNTTILPSFTSSPAPLVLTNLP